MGVLAFFKYRGIQKTETSILNGRNIVREFVLWVLGIMLFLAVVLVTWVLAVIAPRESAVFWSIVVATMFASMAYVGGIPLPHRCSMTHRWTWELRYLRVFTWYRPSLRDRHHFCYECRGWIAE